MNYIRSVLIVGSSGAIIRIECQVSNGLPSIVIVGLGSKAVDEAKERIRSAFASTSIILPRKRITINLAPADIPKESTSLDLAIAAAIMATNGSLAETFKDPCAIIGEIGLNGDVQPVRGIIGTLLAGKYLGISRFVIPEANLKQALLVPDTELIPLDNIRQLAEASSLTAQKGGSPIKGRRGTATCAFSDIAGQSQAKRAMEIAAAGGHNILLTGPPGTGKSMLAKALPGILPPMTHSEILEVTHLHSLANNTYDELVTERPFRSPHHSSSHVSIVGGGAKARPGEISLSHRGVLFLDELPEFNRTTLEAMRQPLEDRLITIARVRQTVEYPASFILVATANPCPCGFFGTDKPCSCTPGHIQRYQQRLSGPILDRIDLHVTVDTVQHEKLLGQPSDEHDDDAVQERVAKARMLQHQRYSGGDQTNASMTNREIKAFACLTPEAQQLLNQAAARMDISARSYMRIVKVGRTIADLEGSLNVEPNHISEALQYRTGRTQ